MNLFKKIRRAFTMPTIEQMLRQQLDDARFNRLEATMKREEWTSHEDMLSQRIDRLINELKEYEK
jgi:hypothetical protein